MAIPTINLCWLTFLLHQGQRFLLVTRLPAGHVANKVPGSEHDQQHRCGAENTMGHTRVELVTWCPKNPEIKLVMALK